MPTPSRLIRWLGACSLPGALLLCAPGPGRGGGHPLVPTAPPRASAPAGQVEPPALLVFIVADQFRPDYLSRYRLQFTGGLARLLKGGAFFSEAYDDHSLTQTPPGPARHLSGRFSPRTGSTRYAFGGNGNDPPLPQVPR